MTLKHLKFWLIIFLALGTIALITLLIELIKNYPA